jgi:anaerobic dimethyl sulfoxide reductase subunit B (iron-sulfur subunit)
MTQFGFYFDQTRCIGCHTCSIACKDWHDIDAGPVNWRRVDLTERGTFPDLFVAYTSTSCNHCAEPPCVKVCPEKAINKRESNGIVVVDQEKCLGNKECNMHCLNVCPWNAPQFGLENGAKMEKCDLCIDRLKQGKAPICIEACPMYALDAGPLEVLREKYDVVLEEKDSQDIKKFKPSLLSKQKLT